MILRTQKPFALISISLSLFVEPLERDEYAGLEMRATSHSLHSLQVLQILIGQVRLDHNKAKHTE